MTKASIIGFDLAKHLFQVNGASAERVGGIPKENIASQAPSLSVVATEVCGGDGGLCRRALLGPRYSSPGP